MLVIRKLGANEAALVKDHLLRLDAEDRRLRFGNAVTPEVILAICDAIQWQRSWMVGAFEGELLRGVAELRDIGTAEPRTGELAVTVERAFQDRGVGTRLMEEALLIARNRGFASLYLLCLPDNPKMQHVARKFSDRIRFEDGAVEVRIRSRQPDALSVFAEWFSDAIALWQTTMDRAAASSRKAADM
jgi:RimJ/RimL family protein N-acetyltransferase